MPEGYVHAHIAELALSKSGINVGDRAAYLWGAQGPDPFSIYKILGSRGNEGLKELSEAMHTRYTGEFIAELLARADTPTKQSYTEGFITHYIADIIIHPYVESQTRDDGRFVMRHGHGFCEASLDSYIHLLKNGTARVDGRYISPRMSSESVRQVCQLMSGAIESIYGITAECEDIKRAFSAVGFYRRNILSGGFIARWLAVQVERYIIKDPGAIMCHFTPGEQPKHGHTSEWKNPFTGETSNKSPLELVDQAVCRSGAVLGALQKYFFGKLGSDELLRDLGSLDYVTGLPWNGAIGEM